MSTTTTELLRAVRVVTDALDQRGFLDGRQGHAARSVLRDLVDSLAAEDADAHIEARRQ